MATLRKSIGMPIGLPAFAPMVRIAAPLLMKTDPELAIHGRYVVSKRLAEMGFEFRYPTLAAALADLAAPSDATLPSHTAATVNERSEATGENA